MNYSMNKSQRIIFLTIKSIIQNRELSEEDLKNSLSIKLTQFLNTSNIEDVFKNIFKYFGSFLGGALCTLFISFFLLKDIELIKENLLAIFPTKNEKSIREILKLSKRHMHS